MEIKPQEGTASLETLLGFKGRVLYGVPEDTSVRPVDKDGKAVINNAQLLAILEHGSPVKNLPPRELLAPVAKKHKASIERTFKKVFDALLDGDRKTADSLMERLAFQMETWCKSYFREDNGWVPDKPATIRAKNRRAGLPPDAPTTTLIDTGELRKSIRGIYLKD